MNRTSQPPYPPRQTSSPPAHPAHLTASHSPVKLRDLPLGFGHSLVLGHWSLDISGRTQARKSQKLACARSMPHFKVAFRARFTDFQRMNRLRLLLVCAAGLLAPALINE